MRARLRLLAALTTLVAIGLLAPALVRAANAEDIAAQASTKWLQTCATSPGDITCTGPTSRVHVWTAVIAPAKGPVTDLRTTATMFGAPPMDPESRNWMIDLHTLACGDVKAVTAFVDDVAILGNPGTVPARGVGACRMAGGMDLDPQGRDRYRVDSTVLPPPPTPSPTPNVTPTPQATPQPTPQATPQQTPKPTPKATKTPAPTAAPSVAPPLPSVAPSVAPSATPSVEPSTASPSPEAPAEGETFQPTQQVAAETSVPAASQDPPAAPPPKRPPSFSDTVLAVETLNTEPRAVGGSLVLALLLLLIVGFAGELFNNTVENNYDRIAAWFRKGPLARVGGLLGRGGWFGVLAFIALTALISSFVDPSLGLDVRSLAVFLGFLVGLVVVLASFKLPPMLAHRRATGELGRLRPLPWALVIAALFVLVSRIGNLQPGYLYGIVLGAIFVTDVSDREEGRETLYGSIWTLAAALVAWLALGWVRSAGGDPDGFLETLLMTAFAAILVAGLEATAFGLMPLRFMPGHAVYRWNRLGWALLFGISVFAFVHVLIGPTSGYVSELSPAAFIAALGVFAAFGALSIATWLYFRLRPQQIAEQLES